MSDGKLRDVMIPTTGLMHRSLIVSRKIPYDPHEGQSSSETYFAPMHRQPSMDNLVVTNGSIPKATLRWLAPALALALAGCSAYQKDMLHAHALNEAANKTVPANYRADILGFMRTYLNDPTRVRGAFVSEPALRTFDHTDRYTACLRYSARKSDGQYAGSKDSLVLFRDGRLDRVVDNAREQCKDAAYKPFPELEHITR